MNTENFDTEQFVCLLTESQPKLYGYIRTLLPDHAQASDVLQNVNMVIWRRGSTFSPGTSFIAWARKIAYFEVLTYYRDQQREKLIFDVELVEVLAKQNDSRPDEHDSRVIALENCLSKLTEKSRALIRSRYDSSQSVQSIAEHHNRTVGSISQALYRIRHQLLECVTKNLNRAESK